MAFKAQTRIWGYNLKKGAKEDELTQVLVDSTVKDESATAQDASPLQAQREWQQQAEDNVVERLQNAGLLAPQGEVDKVLQTVVNNLKVTNNIELPRPVRARVMLTSPLETFSVGNTIIVSRGLVDVLPDEASLAMVLSHELATHCSGTQPGQQIRLQRPHALLRRVDLPEPGIPACSGRGNCRRQEGDRAVEEFALCPEVGHGGVVPAAVEERGPALSALLTPHLGNSLTDSKGAVERMAALMTSAPALDPNKLDQIAALPLGGRVKVNPWDDHVELIKTAPVAITSARDKMPFEVTPFFPRLTRYGR